MNVGIWHELGEPDASKAEERGDEFVKRKPNPIFQQIEGNGNPLSFGPPKHFLFGFWSPKFIFLRDVEKGSDVGELRRYDGRWGIYVRKLCCGVIGVAYFGFGTDGSRIGRGCSSVGWSHR